MCSIYNYNYKLLTEAKSMMNDEKSIRAKLTDDECLCTYVWGNEFRIEAHDDFEMLFPELDLDQVFDGLMSDLAEFKPRMICRGLIGIKMN